MLTCSTQDRVYGVWDPDHRTEWNPRYPNIVSGPSKVHKVLQLNPVFFKDLGEGVYLAIKGRRRMGDDESLNFFFNNFFK